MSTRRRVALGLAAVAAVAGEWAIFGGFSASLGLRATGSGGIGSVSSGVSELLVESGLAAFAIAIVVTVLSVVTRKGPRKPNAS